MKRSVSNLIVCLFIALLAIGGMPAPQASAAGGGNASIHKWAAKHKRNTASQSRRKGGAAEGDQFTWIAMVW